MNLRTELFERGLFWVFLRLPQGNSNVHSFCTSLSAFAVAARNKLAQSGFIENVRVPELTGRLRWSQRQPAILEGELPGNIPEMRVSACWLSGHCGLLPHPAHWAGKGRWPPQSLQFSDRRVTILRPLRANAALLVCAARLEVSPAVSRWKVGQGTPRTMRFRWLAGAAFVFPACFSENAVLAFRILFSYAEVSARSFIRGEKFFGLKLSFPKHAPRFHRALRTNVLQPASKILWQLPNTRSAVCQRT